MVCIIDDNPNKWGRDIEGIPIIGGRNDIPEAVREYLVDKIYLAIPSASGQDKKEILNICQKTGCELMNLPGAYQFMLGDVTVNAMKQVDVEDLLGREAVKLGGQEIDNYASMLRGDLQTGENVKMLRERLEREFSQNKQEHISPSVDEDTSLPASPYINIGDVIAVTTDGLTTAYYVDPTKLILLPDFFHQPTSGALITIDSDNLPLDGRKGSWMTIDTLRIDGRNLFLMQSETYGRDAPYVIVDEHGKELTADKDGFTPATIEQIRTSLKEMETEQALQASQAQDKKPRLEVWQQYFENGEYLRAAEITEEQNYNMIDGTMNNRGPKRSILIHSGTAAGEAGTSKQYIYTGTIPGATIN